MSPPGPPGTTKGRAPGRIGNPPPLNYYALKKNSDPTQMLHNHRSAEPSFPRRYSFDEHNTILVRRETDRLQALAREQIAAQHLIVPPPAADRVRRAARISRRCPPRNIDDERWSSTATDAWNDAVAHLRLLGYDVRPVVPSSARRTWKRQHCRCCAYTGEWIA